ncbi:probable cytochrome P450 4d20 [Pararge aegeria]|uniref:Jg13202 protein n=1 Tax=Pararge aegeria aegeria TaxID=348720 RepID=A0A8S4SK20_9NEOP|nr:probable cytochrome P450 4d20 [Pararge aegeria]CAH2265744.1 jg13202 [Pararge aegeria aegeria]
MYVVLLLGFIIIIVFLYDYAQKRSDRWKKLSEFPGDATLPLIGNGLQLGFDADEAPHKLMALWVKHGKQNFRLTVGYEDWILLSDPDDIGSLLNHSTELSKTVERNAAIKPFFGDSVSSSEGVKWRSMRKLMAPSFNFKNTEKWLEDVNKSCDRLFNILDTYDSEGPEDVYRYLRPYFFDLLCGTLMGVDSNLLADPDHPYLKASGKVVKILTHNLFAYWRNIPVLFVLTPMYWDMVRTIKTMRQASTLIINERKHKLKQFRDDSIKNNKNVDIDIEVLLQNQLNYGGSMLDALLRSKLPNGESTPNQIISDEVTLACFTGHYTTTKTVSHTLYCLAKYPDVQRKIVEEQRSIFNNDFDKKPTNQELSQMKYLEAVIKETIRVIPTVTKIGRQLQNDFTFKDGRVAPAGTSLIVFYEALYQNPKVFPEPEKYIPERHLESVHTFSLVPFSAGPRMCIGFRYAWVAMKSTLSNLLRRYEIIPGGPGTEPKFAHRIITESKNGLQLRLKKRKL